MNLNDRDKKHWTVGASELFNLYVEVGEVKLSSLKSEDCRFVECWISSHFHSGCVREECQNKKRRPIYGVIEYIEKLCEGENTCVLIMEDDTENAVRDWADAIYLLVKYLKRIDNVKAAVIFTKQTRDEISNLKVNHHSFACDPDECLALYETVDACVTQQSNIFSNSKDRKIFINDPGCSKYIKNFPKD